MRAVQQELATGVQRLRGELELYEILSEALSVQYKSNESALRAYGRRARRMVYANTIIGCYGLIEQTVDSILMIVAESYGHLWDRYQDLPDQVRSAHRDLTIQCLRDGDKTRVRSPVSEELALGALGRRPDERPELLAAVFTLSTANYRLPYVQTLFNRLALNISDGLTLGQPEPALDLSGFANYESFLDQLVQRRNDLAHSYGDENIVEPNVLFAYVELVDGFLQSVARVANLHIIKRLAEQKLAAVGQVVATWTGRIGVRLTASEIRRGDQLLLLKEDWCTSHEILSLQSNGANFDLIEFTDSPWDVSAAVRVVPSSTENATTYVIPREWEEYWPPETKFTAS